MQLSAGQRLGPYEIVSEAGSGGMGLVYRARDTRLGRDVALKVLPPRVLESEDRKRRFMQEARAASSLNHPNIVTIYDIAEQDGLNFIVMEFIDGQTLDALIPKEGMRFSEVLRLMLPVAEALQKAHAAGIVHRDLKPSNVMVSKDGLVKLLDFGLAKLHEPEGGGGKDDATQTADGTLSGTVNYMSPEQAEGRAVDGRSDIFSFGAVLYELLSGRRAFQGESRVRTLAAVLEKEPDPMTGVPPELEKLVGRCLRKDPARRFQTMADVKAALEDLKAETASGQRITRPVRAAGAKPARNWWKLAAMASLAVTLVAVVFVLAQPRRPMGRPPNMRTVPLTAFPGEERDPTFSPDGSQVAYSWNGGSGSNFDIYVQVVGGAGKPLRITSDELHDSSPEWSPDGRWIAFFRCQFPRRTATGQLVLTSPLGGQERVLAEVSGISTRQHFAWLPDSKGLIVPDRRDGQSGLLWIPLDGGTPRLLTKGRDTAPAISQDGKRIAFQRMHEGAIELWLAALAPDGSIADPHLRASMLSGGMSWVSETAPSTAWNSDGRMIFLSIDTAEARGRLYRVEADSGRPPFAMPFEGHRTRGVAFSRENGKMAYGSISEEISLWRVDWATGRKEVFAPSTRDEFAPAFSPDGKRVAFLSNRSGHVEVWLADAEGGNVEPLTSFGGPEVVSPRWLPNGKQIVVNVREGEHSSFQAVTAPGGAVRTLAKVETHMAPFQLSRDGQGIYYHSHEDKTQGVWRLEWNSGKRAKIAATMGMPVGESEDGRALFLNVPGGVAVLRLDGAGANTEQAGLMVLGEGKGALYGAEMEDLPEAGLSLWNLLALKPAPGGPRLDAVVPRWPSLARSPDGRYVIYTRQDRLSEDLMLVEGMR